MTAEEVRDNSLRLLEDPIGRALAESHRNRELRAAPSCGRPLNLGDSDDETPADLHMADKILKDAGVVPPEVELMRQQPVLRLEKLGRARRSPDLGTVSRSAPTAARPPPRAAPPAAPARAPSRARCAGTRAPAGRRIRASSGRA